MQVRGVATIPLLIAIGLTIGCAAGEARPGMNASSQPAQAPEQRAALFDNLGSHGHPITTSSALAQRYFDQGLIFTYGFNHGEAIRSFREGIRHDPQCAMCYWGVANALGPNINAPMPAEAVPEAYEALQRALELAPQANDAERAYIEALSARYVEKPTADRHALDVAYAEAMRRLAHRYPDDLDAATLFAEALMDTMPWHYWTPEGEPRPGTTEILTTLEYVLERNPNHPGANHFYIHAVEAAHPEKALPAADRLCDLVPGVGHLVHMPAHIYLRVGDYDAASRANERAAKADESYFTQSLSQGLYPALYYPHNIHFLWYSATLEGRDAVAINAARRLVTIIGEEQVRAQPGLELFLPTPLYALTQFGRWDQVLAEPMPAPEFTFHRAMRHYARGMALAAKGNLQGAEGELANLQQLSSNEKIRSLDTEALAFPATRLVQIAQHTLAGELARQGGQHGEAVRHFQMGVDIQDGLPYMEPPYWYVPVRMLLGDALLHAGRPGEAELVYEEDLKRNPRNGWSLFGLRESLRAQAKNGEADEVQGRLERAWSRATVTLTASRF